MFSKVVDVASGSRHGCLRLLGVGKVAVKATEALAMQI